jgi:hypothetical protein
MPRINERINFGNKCDLRDQIKKKKKLKDKNENRPNLMDMI